MALASRRMLGDAKSVAGKESRGVLDSQPVMSRRLNRIGFAVVK
jgi:hypothetical protein